MQSSVAGLRSVVLLLCVSFFTAAQLLGVRGEWIAARRGDRPFGSSRGQSYGHGAR